MPQKLAIAISGTVSLSSYEAGVLYEVVEAIAQHNCHPDTAAEQRIEIDVVTGVSAGTMTACILTQKLMFEAEALRQPHANALYEPWVEDLDITEMLKPHSAKDLSSIFLSERMAEIGSTYLLQRYATGQPTPRQRHPAAASSVQLGLATSNLNGIEHTLHLTDFPEFTNPAHRSPRLTYTRHDDVLIQKISDSDADDHLRMWQKLEKIARSSSAPFLFRPLHHDSGPIYTDGGLFENEPLGLAKNLVDQIDPQHLDHHNRFYLYVGPSARTTVNLASNATSLNTGAALIDALFTQTSQNWITISHVNEQIRQFEHQIKELSDVLIKSPALSNSFSRVADALLAILYSQEPVSAQFQQADQQRLRQQFTEEYERIVYATNTESIAGEAVAKSWLRLVQVLEKIQHLGNKDVMTVYALTAEAAIADRPFALKSCLDQSLRDLDYSAGRHKAVTFLKRLQTLNQHGKSEGQLYLTNFVPGHNLKPLPKDFANLAHLNTSMDWIPIAKRQAVKAQLLDRAQQVIDTSESRFWVRWLLKFSLGLFLSKQLDRLLELK